MPNTLLKRMIYFLLTIAKYVNTYIGTEQKQTLKVVKELYVVESEVMENMDITLICIVNEQTKSRWMHNKKEIAPNSRVVAGSDNLEHKLTIRNTQSTDEGEYMVVFASTRSWTKLTVKGITGIVHKQQLTETMYRNWVRATLGLKYLKVGLEKITDKVVQRQHTEILSAVTGTKCTQCTAEDLLPHKTKFKRNQHNKNCLCLKEPQKRRMCPNGGFCGKCYDVIVNFHIYQDPSLKNTQIQKWATDPWSVATSFINVHGYEGRSSSREIDCSGILSMFINNTRYLADVAAYDFEKARDARNEIFHNSNYELSDGQLKDFIVSFKNVLEVTNGSGAKVLSNEPGVKEAIDLLDKLKDFQIDIQTIDDLQQHQEQLKQHCMNECAEKLIDAEKQKNVKVNNLEERLKKQMMELQLLRDLQSAHQTEKSTKEKKVPFCIDLHVRVTGSPQEPTAKAKSRIYQLMKEEVSKYKRKSEESFKYPDPTCSEIRHHIQCVLGYLFRIKDSQIDNVLQSTSSVDLKVQCFTCQAIEQLLTLLNGNKFQEELVELRRGLEREIDRNAKFDLELNFSSSSLDYARQQLDKKKILKGVTNDLMCDSHQDIQKTWYDSIHNSFLCLKCKEEPQHRYCVCVQIPQQCLTLVQIPQQCLTLRGKPRECSVRMKHKVADHETCSIHGICMSTGNILLVDHNNKRLKKLNDSFKLKGYCSLQSKVNDVCYLGNNRAVVCLENNTIQFVNVPVYGDMTLEHVVPLDHLCYSLACHGDILYIADNDTVYCYTTVGMYKRVLYRKRREELVEWFSDIAVSDDGEIIYIAEKYVSSLVTIDKNGNPISTLKTDIDGCPTNVCVVCDGTLLLGYKDLGRVLHVDFKSGRILQTVVTGITPRSMCYDKKHSRLIIGYEESDNVSIYGLHHSHVL